jgi:hypothetical protein
MPIGAYYGRRNSFRLLSSCTKFLVSKMKLRQRKAAENSCQSVPMSCLDSADRTAIERAEDEGMTDRTGLATARRQTQRGT